MLHVSCCCRCSVIGKGTDDYDEEEDGGREAAEEEPVLPELDPGDRETDANDKMDFSLEGKWKEVKRALVNAVGGGIVAQLIQALLDVVANDRDR